MDIRKSIFKIFSANFLQLISGIIVGFFVPAILSIEGYANLKTYTLYLSYVGLLHLGFIDGMYIKYGGKKINEINKGKLKAEHNTILILELILTAIVICASFIIKNTMLALLGISILPAILSTFYKGIYQATGEFKQYSNIIYAYTITYTITNIFLTLIKCTNYIFYCLSVFFSYLLSTLYYEIVFNRKNKTIKSEYSKELVQNIKVGFFILLGNLSFVLFTGADKWFIKIFFSDIEFAYYSFAISMLNIVNTLISAISVTFYNYLFNIEDEQKINKLKEYLIILGGLASSSYFVLNIFVKTFLTKYVDSLNIIAITFSAIPYIILINALFVNLYKIKKDEKGYFKSVFLMLVIAIIYNFMGLKIYKSTLSIAFATLLSFITWTIYSSIKLKEIRINNKYIYYLLLSTISFLVLSHIENPFVGFGLYIFNFIILTIIIYKEIIIEIYEEIKNIFIWSRERGKQKK